MRSVVVVTVLVLALSGCQTTSAPKFNLSEVDAIKRMPKQCEYRANYTSQTTFSERPMPDALKQGGGSAYGLTGASNGLAFIVECICKDTFRPEALNNEKAEALVIAAMGNDARASNIRYNHNSSIRMVDFDFEANGLMGTSYGSGRTLASSKCLESFMVLGTRPSQPEYATFLNTIRPISQPAQPATVTVPKPEIAEERLASLKSLYDRKLITKDEYDRKRKEIVDTM